MNNVVKNVQEELIEVSLNDEGQERMVKISKILQEEENRMLIALLKEYKYFCLEIWRNAQFGPQAGNTWAKCWSQGQACETTNQEVSLRFWRKDQGQSGQAFKSRVYRINQVPKMVSQYGSYEE